MKSMRVLFAVSLGVALAAACGGTTESGSNGSGDDGGASSSSGGSGSSSGSTSSSSSSGSSSGGPAVDGGSVGPVACGMTTCTAPQVCCVTRGPSGGSETCVAPGSCMGIALTCSSAQSCPSGDVCCGTVSGGGGTYTINTSCEASCPMGQGNFQLCASTAECPTGRVCRAGPGGFKICVRAYDGGSFDGGFPPPDSGAVDAGAGG
jgi:hypothetical protein